jgi:hypothetical protein
MYPPPKPDNPRCNRVSRVLGCSTRSPARCQNVMSWYGPCDLNHILCLSLNGTKVTSTAGRTKPCGAHDRVRDKHGGRSAGASAYTGGYRREAHSGGRIEGYGAVPCEAWRYGGQPERVGGSGGLVCTPQVESVVLTSFKDRPVRRGRRS